jgi:hypothetical protein
MYKIHACYIKKQSKNSKIKYSIGNKSNNILDKIQHKKMKIVISIISWACRFIYFDVNSYFFHQNTFLTAQEDQK